MEIVLVWQVFKKLRDHQSHNNSSSGEHKYLHLISQESIH